MATKENSPIVSNVVGYFGEFKPIPRKDETGNIKMDKNGNEVLFGLLSIDLPNGERKTLGVSGSVAFNDCMRKQSGDVVNVSFEKTIKGQTTYRTPEGEIKTHTGENAEYVREIFGSSMNAINASRKITLDEAQKRIENAPSEARDAIARLMERAI